MHILFVADVGIEKVIGGAERVLHSYVTGFRRHGHRVELLTPRASVDDGGCGQACAVRRCFRLFRGALGTCLAFRRLLLEDPPDIINFHQPLSAFLALLCAGGRSSIPGIYTFHSSAAQEYATRVIRSGKGVGGGFNAWTRFNILIRKWMERYALARSRSVLVLSAFSREILADLHSVPPPEVILIPGGADLKQFKPVPDRLALRERLAPGRSHLLFTVRNLVPRMGLENLIEAMATIVPKHPGVLLIIGGEGPLKADLAAMIERLHLEGNIRFEGFIPEERLATYYQAADLFVLPTRMLEGFGLVTVEALACGAPVLGTPVGGTVEILQGLDWRLICDGAESHHIASRLSYFLAHPAELENIRGRCRAYVAERYDWEKIISRIEELFKSHVV